MLHEFPSNNGKSCHSLPDPAISASARLSLRKDYASKSSFVLADPKPEAQARDPKAEIPQGGTKIEIRRMLPLPSCSDFGLRVSDFDRTGFSQHALNLEPLARF